MALDIERASAFVSRLLSSPALQELTPPQKEEQIIQFLVQNGRALQPTLCSAPFFPSKSWAQIEELLLGSLRVTIDEMLVAMLQKLLLSEIDFTFLPLIAETRIPADKCREQLFAALRRAVTRADIRRSLAGPLNAVFFSLPSRYLERSFERREYVHFELTKVQRLRAGPEEIKNMVSVTLLARPLMHLLAAERPEDAAEGPEVVTRQYAQKAIKALQNQLALVPPALISSAVRSGVSFFEDNRLEATARITAVFAARGKGYRPGLRVDRGADSPDKSWLRIARRNAKAYGFDTKMLDELYKIAADNSW